MDIDLRFTDITYEVMMLSEYVTILETAVPTIVNAERARIRAEFDPADDELSSTGFHLVSQLDSGITTRALTSSALIATWATYESAVVCVAEHVRRAGKVTTCFSQARGRGGFLKTATKYFRETLGFPLHPQPSDHEFLTHLAVVRHTLTHANGRLSDVPRPKRAQLQTSVARLDGVAIVDDEYVVVSTAGARAAFTFIERVLTDLVYRAASPR